MPPVRTVPCRHWPNNAYDSYYPFNTKSLYSFAVLFIIIGNRSQTESQIKYSGRSMIYAYYRQLTDRQMQRIINIAANTFEVSLKSTSYINFDHYDVDYFIIMCFKLTLF